MQLYFSFQIKQGTLSADPLPIVLHVPGCFQGFGIPQEPGYHIKGHVDSGRDPGGDDHLPIVDKPFFRADPGPGRHFAEKINRPVMGGGLQPVQQAGLGQQQRPLANRQDQFRVHGAIPDPFNQPGIMHLPPRIGGPRCFPKVLSRQQNK